MQRQPARIPIAHLHCLHALRRRRGWSIHGNSRQQLCSESENCQHTGLGNSRPAAVATGAALVQTCWRRTLRNCGLARQVTSGRQMAQDTHPDPNVKFSEAALNEWVRHVEAALRGVSHALNNRAAALSAIIELSAEPAEDAEAIRSLLKAELDRVQTLSRAVRLVGAPRSGVEAFAPADAVREARAVLEFHADVRDRGVTIDAGKAAPVRVERWQFVRALIALAAECSRDHNANVGRATITIFEDGDWLVTRVDGVLDRGPTALVMELARAMDGEPLTEAGGYGFRVPTLSALRRREGR